jgi:hypothetical protein
MEICIDCVMVHVNGDSSGIDSPERLAEVLAGLETYPFLAVETEDHWFSWHSCDACGSTYGGDRMKAELIER